MNAALSEPLVVALEPELGSTSTVQALALTPKAAIKAVFSRNFIG